MKTTALVTSHYTPETGAAAKRLSATARHLQSRGWRVTVITLLPHHPTNSIYDGFDERTPFVQVEEGIKVIRYRPWIVPNTNLAVRLVSEALFCWHAFLYLLRYPHDLVFGSSPYMFLGLTVLLASRLRKAKVVWEVRDLTWLYPRSAGKRTFGLDALLEKLMRWTAEQSDALITATNGLLHYFSRRPKPSAVIPNGVTPKLLAELSHIVEAPLFQQARPKVLYAGLFGHNHKLTTLLDAAKLLPDIDFTLAGDGPEKEVLKRKATSLNLSNVTFVGYLRLDALARAYGEHDILVSHVRRDPLHRWTQPAKLWEYMATGRPVVHAGEGEAVDTIEEHGLGLCCPPEDAEALAEAIQSLVDHPEKALALGQSGREFVEEHRNRVMLLDELEALLTSLLPDSERTTRPL